MYSITSSANSDSLTSSFPIWIPFISFSSRIAVAKASKTMLNSYEARCYELYVLSTSDRNIDYSLNFLELYNSIQFDVYI